MNIPYRTRRVLSRLGIASLILLIVFILVWFCWVIWLERYIVYTRDGAVINFELSRELPEGEVALPPSGNSGIEIYFNEGDNTVNTSKELAQITGYYIDVAALSSDVAGVRDTVKSLEIGTAVMIDLKDIKGNFYYSSSLPDAAAASVDTAAVESLISLITNGDYYAIARVPAFRDYRYGLNHVDSGLAHVSYGGALWMDDKGCYWLDPTDSSVLNYLIQITEELKRMGFNEIVFSDFCFPSTEKIVFSGDKTEAITGAMNTILTNCATTSFGVSFTVTDASITLPEARSRLYLENVDAKNVGLTVSQATVADPKIQLVFVAQTNDTRFDEYSVLRPIDAASVLEDSN